MGITDEERCPKCNSMMYWDAKRKQCNKCNYQKIKSGCDE